ncbi:MAG TPA: DUF1569 domain-containing protein [Pedobacter sp.]|nr:DUF1569 domain-containing protein [Pedobacter sp.]
MLITILNKETREELINRINALHTDHKAQWGKMNVCQMAKHCTKWNDWVQGKNKPEYKQGFLGLIFGRMVLEGSVKDNSPIKKNMPAGDAFTVKDANIDLAVQKEIWIRQVSGYEHFSNPEFIHDFFGKMTKEQIGIFAYKHLDHHLRQFNV